MFRVSCSVLRGGELAGRERLMATLLYGSGLRLLECVRLRIKEVDFEKREILVRAGKGDKDRVTMLPESIREPLGVHLESVHQQYEADLAQDFGDEDLAKTHLPDVLNHSRTVQTTGNWSDRGHGN